MSAEILEKKCDKFEPDLIRFDKTFAGRTSIIRQHKYIDKYMSKKNPLSTKQHNIGQKRDRTLGEHTFSLPGSKFTKSRQAGERNRKKGK